MRILVADSHELFRTGVVALLKGLPQIEVVGECSTANRLFELSAELDPDVVLLDVALDASPAAPMIKALRRHCPGAKIVVVADRIDEIFEQALREAGAAGYVSTSSSLDCLAAALLSKAKPSDDSSKRERRTLSSRENDVLRLLAAGLSNREIAAELIVAEGTVKRHTHSIYRKLGAPSRISAVNKARLIGLL